MKVNSGNDFQADCMGAHVATSTATATGVTATTLTNTGASWTTNEHAGRQVTMGSRYATILSNTGTVLTLDRWYDPATPGGAAGSTPAAGVYVILPGQNPGAWMALTENSGAPAAGDTTLTGELAAAGGGLIRALATYGHTGGANSYTLTKTFTANANDSPPKTPAKMGVFNAQNGGRMIFETLIPSPAAMIAADTLTLTETVTT